MQKLDILAFGAHPDDVELGCGGTLIGAIAEGKKVGIIDLTKGELGTRGTVAQRLKEAELARDVMGLNLRENLGMADGFFQNDKAHQLLVIQCIRKYKPSIIFCNAPEDRHPDHGRASNLVEEAAFLSGLSKIETSCDGIQQEAWRPTQVFHYIQSRTLTPNFVVDISMHIEKKMESIRAHSSQFFDPHSKEPDTFISSAAFLEFVKGRAKELGQQIGVAYAEGFITKKILGIASLDAIIQNKT